MIEGDKVVVGRGVPISFLPFNKAAPCHDVE